jgi:hypothetical protein
MYHIYSSEKHKVYQIGAARIQDGEDLGDLHNAPCLKDGIPTEHKNIPEQLDSETDDETVNGLRCGDNNLLSDYRGAGLETKLFDTEEDSIQLP